MVSVTAFFFMGCGKRSWYKRWGVSGEVFYLTLLTHILHILCIYYETIPFYLSNLSLSFSPYKYEYLIPMNYHVFFSYLFSPSITFSFFSSFFLSLFFLSYFLFSFFFFFFDVHSGKILPAKTRRGSGYDAKLHYSQIYSNLVRVPSVGQIDLFKDDL